MTVEQLSVEDLDYLQRTGLEPPPVGGRAGMTQAPLLLRKLMRVHSIGRLDKARHSEAPAGFLTNDLLVGLYNYKLPVAFLVRARPGEMSIRIGTWLPAGGSSAEVEENAQLLEASLQGLYPAIESIHAEAVVGSWELGGLALGIPTPKAPDVLDGALPVDRLLRGLQGLQWAALVLAQPVEEAVARDLRLRVINEMRSVQTAVKHEAIPSPLADHYLKLLERQLESLTNGQGMGSWRTAVYLLGDVQSYHRVTTLWRSVFSGEHSVPEPVRVWDRPDVPMLAEKWAMVDPVDQGGTPGHYYHPFQHQTLLTSAQLATYMHLPNLETNGFSIMQVPDFDVVPPPLEGGSLVVGSVVQRQRVTANDYGVRTDRLTRHAFVTGGTGSGKTNTLFYLLRQVAAAGVPFLVIEPAKTEYRVLVHDEALGKELRVFTLGEETISPFRLNPFEVPVGIPVAVHLDLLRSVFNMSFGMWTPLPQVLEVSLHGIYSDRGWDVTSNSNRRLEGDTPEDSHRADAFPTLSDLVRKVEEVVPQLGYEDRVTADIRAALRTRLNSLRTGGKGRMLDVRRSISMESLLSRPTVLELEGMGDDDDKAFTMGLLMIRLAEYRRTQGDIEGLRHLLVIEEAHRLLANPGSGRDEAEANVRGKAVETFTNLLSEVRAYGQGIVVADQIPARLAPDVVKNTNLKMAHRIVAGDDREILGAAMAMTRSQTVSLSTLPVGRAAVFSEGEDAPLLIQVPRAKGGSGTWPSNDEVRQHMSRLGSEEGAGGGRPLRRVAAQHRRAHSESAIALGIASLPSSDCDMRCAAAVGACEISRRLVEEPVLMRTLARVVLSAVQTAGGLERSWPDVVATVEPHRPSWVEGATLLACVARHGARTLADERGARAGWTYAQTAAVAELIDEMLLAHLQDHGTAGAVAALRVTLLGLQGDTYGPFQGCASIWGSRSGPCLCRYPVTELVVEGAFAKGWTDARTADRSTNQVGGAAVWELCQDAAYQLVEFPADEHDDELAAQVAEVARCTALCFAQQMLASEAWAHPATQRRVLKRLLEGASPGDAGNAGRSRQ